MSELEGVLERRLARVAAPPELWERVSAGRTIPNRRMPIARRTLAFALAATLSLALLVVATYPRSPLQSEKAPEIRAWIKQNTGLDIPLPAEPSPLIRLSGARVVKGGAEVRFQVNHHDATLLVAKAPTAPGDGKHRFVSKTSWTMRGQSYTVASDVPEDSSAACLLCHTGAD